MTSLRIVEAGWATTVQDAGRRGAAALGVPRAGPVDAATHRRVNRLVGNPADTAALETAGGLVVEALRPLIVATSAEGQRHTLRPGQRLTVSAAPDTQWAYLSVRGGLLGEVVLGSRSHDTLSGLGPPPIRVGDEFAVGVDPGLGMPTDLAPVRRSDELVRVWPAPRHPAALHSFTTTLWRVKEEVSRVGVRLVAASASPDHTIEVPPRGPSEGLVVGAIQLTPSGEAIVMLANHPTTGGYPVIGVVDPADVGHVAQSPPGTVRRFRPA
jgi:biotin-dependent carboxylase-like uncharacterized protein